MVNVKLDDIFEKKVRKIKDGLLQLRLKKLIAKIIEFPEIGKPMMYARRATREVYLPPFRLSYTYIKEEDKIEFLDLYHKDEQ